MIADDPFTDMTALSTGTRAVFGAAGWCWLVAILGLLDRRRQRSDDASPSAGSPGRRRLYGYLAAAVLPLYILHQPIVVAVAYVAVAYVVVDWDAPIPVKYAVIVAVSLALTLAVYDVAVRRTRVTRFLFGMRGPMWSASLSPRSG